MRLLALLGLVCFASACSVKAMMIPVEGPFSQMTPVPVVQAIADGIWGNAGNLTFTMPDGDACRGRWASLAGAGETTITSGSLISQYGTVVGISTAQTVGGSGSNPGKALVTCRSGRLVEVEFMTGAGTGHGYGVAKDNQNNIFKFVF